MANTSTQTKTVAAVVAAYNEERRIGQVLQVLTSYPGFARVVVVDDGSTDGTAQVARKFPVELIVQPANQGKGQAMEAGVRAAQADIIYFCDADVRGLTHLTITETLAPVLADKTDMVIAMTNRTIYYLRFILSIIPLLGGERAVTRRLWQKVPTQYKQDFMIEAALNFYARYYGRGFQYKVVPGLTQTIKERKYGWWTGFKARIQMFSDIMEAQVRLQLREVPSVLRSGRLALANIAGSVVGAAFGVALIAASLTGPVIFVRQVFAQELRDDPDAPLVHFLLNLAGNVGVDLLIALGVVLILVNLLVIALNFNNIRYLLGRPSTAERLD